MPKTRHGRRDKKQVRKEPPAGFGAEPHSVLLCPSVSLCLSVSLLKDEVIYPALDTVSLGACDHFSFFYYGGVGNAVLNGLN